MNQRSIERPTRENAIKNDLQEYVVVLKSEDDKQSFMQGRNIVASQSQTIRQGKVIKCDMTADEALKTQNDPRVESIEKNIPKTARTLGFPSNQERMMPVGAGAETKNNSEPETLTAQALDRTATIQDLPDGFGVDVVLVDGIASPGNPEFAKNADGGGGTRLNQLNWYEVLGYSSLLWESYPYELIGNPDGPDNNHGTHTMGISCGNTQGWASKANIYNIIFNIPQLLEDANFKDLFLQAVKVWHQNKPANPVCGNKNPTITNHSYGYSYSNVWDIRDVISVNYRGQTVVPPRNYSGAQCSASLGGGGIGSIAVTNGGSNYTNAPTVSFYGGGQATATAELANGSVYKITLTEGGSGYTKSDPPTVTFSAPPAGGVRATGTVVSNRWLNNTGAGATGLPMVYINESGDEFYTIGQAGLGQVYHVVITEAGSGYVSAPTVTFSNPPSGGRIAQATAEIKSGFIKRIRITNGGTGYFNDLSVPAVILSGGNPTVSANISLGPVFDNVADNAGSLLDGIYEPYIGGTYYPIDYPVLNMRTKREIYFQGGGDYQTQPTVSFYGGNRHLDDGTIEGTKPEAHAVLGTGANANKVASIVVDRAGSGYTSPPTVVLTNGGGFTVQQLKDYGLTVYQLNAEPWIKLLADIPARDAPIEEDITQLMASGAVVVAAAGNEYYKIDTPTGQDYNNSVKVVDAPNWKADSSILNSMENLVDLYYHRGSTPGACPGVICVGAAGVGSPEYKADFSNTGPRVDVYAPGEYINSSVNSSMEFIPHGIPDPRNSNYSMTKWSGTSMATPQVAGMLACYAQTNRNINQESARNFINSNSKATLIDGTGYLGLQGGANKYAFMPNIMHTTP